MFNLAVLAGLDTLGETIREYIRNSLIPSWVSFVVQFSALVIMLVVVITVAYKPVKKMLNKRAEYVETNIRDSEIAKAEAEKSVVASKEALIASKKEAAEIVANASIKDFPHSEPGRKSAESRKDDCIFLNCRLDFMHRRMYIQR